jgi:hypothetical protein
MKKIFIAFLGAMAFAVSVQAQKKSGAIQYQTSIDPVAMAEASGFPISEEMKARMPRSIKANYELLYNATNASFMPVVETEDSNGGGGQPNMGRMMMRFGGFGGGNKEYYYTFADQKVVEVFDLMDTTYVMPSKLSLNVVNPMMGRPNNASNQSTSAVQFLNVPPTIEVIKSDETKKIVNLNCNKVTIKTTRKATVLGMEKDITDETVLWYTNDLGFNFSPDPNLWTEGAVLAIEKKGGGMLATSIEYRGVSAKDVTAPKKAIAITPEQYQAKQAAMMARFRNNGNRQGGAMRVN